jgi:RNA polymerase sigma-70 factor (ECF subfamily)
MLGDVGRAEDLVQDAWLRWQGHSESVENPKAFLLTVVTHLCLNELASARARHEESRSDRLPEPVDLRRSGMEGVESVDRISMAFLVLLQKLTPAERAVLLLREVFDFDFGEIAALLGKNEVACRQLMKRAKENVVAEKRALDASPEEHRRLLAAFVDALHTGHLESLTKLLADDATVVADGGARGVRIGRVRNLPRPLFGVDRIAAFLTAVHKREKTIERRECELNGQPALLVIHEGRVVAAVLLSVADGKIRNVFIHADPDRLANVEGRPDAIRA